MVDKPKADAPFMFLIVGANVFAGHFKIIIKN